MGRSSDLRPLVPRQAEPLPPGDIDLLNATRSGDTDAYATLYQRHVAAARALARQLVRGRAEADDVVAEAFAKVLAQLRRGRGPDGAFRPYLLTTVRRAAIDRLRAEGKVVVSGEMEAFDPGVRFADPAVAKLERSMIARAFASLPERWRAVLWHTEIEGARPAEVAELLGLTANGVAALAYRAREGLRQAYLQMHLSGVARGECRPVVTKLGAYVRGGLAKRDTAAVAAHLDQCADCHAVYLELADVNVALRGVVAPIVLGPAAAAYIASVSHGGGVLGWLGGRVLWFRHAPKSQQAAIAGATAAGVAGLAALALALTANNTSIVRAAPPSAHVPAPAPPPVPPPSVPRHPPSAPPPPQAPPPPAPRPRHSPPRHSPPPTPPPPSPHRTPAPKPPITLAAQVNPVGELLPGSSGIIQFTVMNPGTRTSRRVTADIALPAGVSYVDPPIAGGWTCQPSAAGATCTHNPLLPGATATGYLPVTVATGAAAGPPPRITVHGGGPASSATGKVGVGTAGLGARFAASGQYSIAAAGAAFGGCRWDPLPCWNGWRDRASAAELTLPGAVQWAGLYWAGHQRNRNDNPSGIELRGPGGDFQEVAAAKAGEVTGPDGKSAFEAFADVTSLVAQYGTGTWCAAPASEDNDGDGDDGGVADFGWTLVVVAADPAAAPGTQVMVLDGAYVVGASGPSLSVPLDALPPGRQAQVRTVTWTRAGPAIGAFPQNLAESPAVTFTGGQNPYLVGVVAVSDAP